MHSHPYQRVLLLVGTLLYLLTGFVQAELSPRRPEQPKWMEVTKYRTWYGKNNRSLEARFMYQLKDMIYLSVKNKEGKVGIKIDNLRADTRSWFETCMRLRKIADEADKKKRKDLANLANLAKQTKSAQKVEPIAEVTLQPGQVLDLRGKEVKVLDRECIPLQKLDRSIVPNFAQGEYGKKASDCVPNSFAMFVGWWHTWDVVRMPKSRKYFEEQVGWLHDRLSRCMKTGNNSGTRLSRAAEYLEKFFQDEMKTDAAFTYDFYHDYTPENIAKYVKGGNATVLCVSVYNGRRSQGGHAVALRLADAEGNVEFNTWGMKLTGKLVPIEGEVAQIWNSRKTIPKYEIVLSVGSIVPDWFENNETRFVLDAAENDGFGVLTPYLAKKKEAEEPQN